MSSTSSILETRRSHWLWLGLFMVSGGLALTGPLTKLAVSTGHHPLGLTLWTTLIGLVVITAWRVLKRRRLPLSRRHVVFFLTCGFLGTAFPNSLSFEAYNHLSVGVNVIIISLVPMATMLLAVLWRVERPDRRRLLGLGLGIGAVALIAIPETSLPDRTQVIWIALPVMIALSYAAENVFIATSRPEDCDALAVMCGLYWGAAALLLPTVTATGTWVDIRPLDTPELALFAVAALHLGAYFGFIWLIEHAGPVFAAQVSYIVTGGGVLLGMILFDERHSTWVWLALATMLVGLFLVKPKLGGSSGQ
jgi:drug/metabolite transporter (DMT)-like permease